MTSRTQTIILIVVAAIGLLIAYQALVVVPNEKIEAEARAVQLKIDAERSARLAREASYLACTSDAYANYSDGWDSQCQIAGKEAGCTLAPYQYQRVEERYKEAQERCVTMYK